MPTSISSQAISFESKSHDEILATLDTRYRNRGLSFDVEMVPFCGGTYRVIDRVEKFIDEKTGRIKSLKTPAVILQDVTCGSRFSRCRMFCPRRIYCWWREIWLERVGAVDVSKASSRLQVEGKPIEAAQVAE